MSSSIESFKKETSSIRKQLIQLYGEKAPSHSQTLEIVAKSKGFSSYAHFLASSKGNPLENSVQSSSSLTSPASYPCLGYYDIEFFEGKVQEYKLFVYDGLTFNKSVAVHEAEDYSVKAPSVFRAGVKICADKQIYRNSDGFSVWLFEDSKSPMYQLPENFCILAPDNFNPASEDCFDLPNREFLLSEYLNLLNQEDNKHLKQSLKTEIETNDYLVTTFVNSSALQKLTEKIGFKLHLGEFFSLSKMI